MPETFRIKLLTVITYIPLLIIISAYEIVSIEIYLKASSSNSLFQFFLWIFMQAIGGVILGNISDNFSRKQTLLGIQISGILFLLFILWQGLNPLSISLLGLFFNPSPVSRAALIDKFPSHSKVKLISTTFLAQFLPWCFYSKIIEFKYQTALLGACLLIFLSLVFTSILFRNYKKSHEPGKVKEPKKWNEKIAFTMGALLIAQLVFFLSDSFFERSANAAIFSALGVGSFLGTIISFFYRRIPHLSLLTICYGLGFLLSVIPFISLLALPIPKINLDYQLVLFSSLGGFYLPFVYDVILTASSSHFRGTACGIIDAIIALSSVIGVTLTLFFHPQETTILFLTAILFISAAYIQKRGEIPS